VYVLYMCLCVCVWCVCVMCVWLPDSIQEKILKVVSRPGNCMIQGTVNYRSCVAFAIFKGSVSLTGSWESQMSGSL